MDKETQKTTETKKARTNTAEKETGVFRKTVLPLLLLLLLLGSLYYIYQQRESVTSNKELAEQYQQDLVVEQEAKAKLGEEYKLLEEENIVLQDSIQMLQNRITELGQLLKDKVGIISRNKDEIVRMQTEMNRLVAEISQLRSEKGANQAKLKQLENERFALDKRIGDLFMQNDTLENENNALMYEIVTKEEERDNLEAQLTDKEKELAGVKGEGPYDIEGKEGILINVNAVEAEFKVIEARTKRNKLSRSAKKWQSTFIQFDIIYPNLDDLVGQNFTVQLINEDTDEVLPPGEDNSGPYNAQGKSFEFKSNPVEVVYANWQDKGASTNYTARLFFMDAKGQENTIASAVAPVKFKR